MRRPAPRSTAALPLLFGVAALTILMAGCERVGAPASASVPPDSAAGEVPFHLAGAGGASIVVPVYINGEGPIDLILDTGATLTCVDDSLATALELPEKVGAIGIGATVGGTGRITLLNVDSMRVGEARATGMTICTMNLEALKTIGPNIHGLLGLNFLKSFHVTIDFERNVLTLGQASPAPASRRARRGS